VRILLMLIVCLIVCGAGALRPIHHMVGRATSAARWQFQDTLGVQRIVRARHIVRAGHVVPGAGIGRVAVRAYIGFQVRIRAAVGIIKRIGAGRRIPRRAAIGARRLTPVERDQR
jgi:hypothetical protein